MQVKRGRVVGGLPRKVPTGRFPKTTMNSTNSPANGIIRGVAAASGGAAFAASHDEWVQIFGAVVTLLSMLWSVWEKRRAAQTPPANPGAGAALLLGCAVLLGSSGCVRLTPEQQLQLVQTVSMEAAYVGTSYDLRDNPSHRAAYVTAVAALDALIARSDYDPAALTAALAGLPALRGADGALLEGGVTLYTVAAGFVDLDTVPLVRAAVGGIRSGISRALARPTGTATRALAPALPPQCTVPPRR